MSVAVAGYLARQGYEWLFIGDAATTLVMRFRLAEAMPATRGTQASAVPRIGLVHVLRNIRFMVLTLLAFLIAAVFIQAPTDLPIDMARRGLSPSTYGFGTAARGSPPGELRAGGSPL